MSLGLRTMHDQGYNFACGLYVIALHDYKQFKKTNEIEFPQFLKVGKSKDLPKRMAQYLGNKNFNVGGIITMLEVRDMHLDVMEIQIKNIMDHLTSRTDLIHVKAELFKVSVDTVDEWYNYVSHLDRLLGTAMYAVSEKDFITKPVRRYGNCDWDEKPYILDAPSIPTAIDSLAVRLNWPNYDKGMMSLIEYSVTESLVDSAEKNIRPALELLQKIKPRLHDAMHIPPLPSNLQGTPKDQKVIYHLGELLDWLKSSGIENLMWVHHQHSKNHNVSRWNNAVQYLHKFALDSISITSRLDGEGVDWGYDLLKYKEYNTEEKSIKCTEMEVKEIIKNVRENLNNNL